MLLRWSSVESRANGGLIAPSVKLLWSATVGLIHLIAGKQTFTKIRNWPRSVQQRRQGDRQHSLRSSLSSPQREDRQLAHNSHPTSDGEPAIRVPRPSPLSESAQAQPDHPVMPHTPQRCATDPGFAKCPWLWPPLRNRRRRRLGADPFPQGLPVEIST